MKPEILALAGTKTLREAAEHIRCGFEFEFHALDGVERGDSNEVDFDRLSDAYYESDRDFDDIISHAESGDETELLKALDAVGLTYDNIDNQKIRNSLCRIMERAEEGHREAWEHNELENNRSEYVNDNEYELFAPGIHDLFEIGDDQSVRGGEIRTCGALTVSQFQKVARVISENDFKVDTNTSFHIHLSVPGVEHAYGARFQAEMYAYLIKNIDKMPAGVKERLVASNGAKKWAKFQIKNGEKFCAIYKHGQGTWEFRLFGNITEYNDMLKCLDIAVGALRHAYQVKIDPAKSLLCGASIDRIASTLEHTENHLNEFFNYLNLSLNLNNNIEIGAA